MDNTLHIFFTPCPRGLEAVLAQELTDLGAADVKPTAGGVAFAGPLALCYRVNLESRIARRVLLRIAEGSYRDEPDADGTISGYSWIKLSGPSATLTNENTAVLSLQDLIIGVYVFRITVSDNNGAFASDNIQVTVFPSSVNQSRTVSAGNNLTVTLPTNTASISATASDPDGSIAAYTWTKQIGPTVTISGENTNTLQLSDLIVGTYTFRINVTDNSGSSSFDEVNITVLPLGSNNPPVVNAGIDKILFLPNSSINLIGLASDNDGSISAYSWVKISGPTATLTNQTTPNLSITNLVAGQYVFRLTATDNLGITAFDEAGITVFHVTSNTAPTERHVH